MSRPPNRETVNDTAKLIMHRLIARELARDSTLVERARVQLGKLAVRFPDGRGPGDGRAWRHSAYPRKMPSGSRSASDCRIQSMRGQSARDSRHRQLRLLRLQRDPSKLRLRTERRCEERLAPAAGILDRRLSDRSCTESERDAAPARHRSRGGIGEPRPPIQNRHSSVHRSEQ